MRIGFASSDWSRTIAGDERGTPNAGGACWYRCVLPGLHLARRGHDVKVGSVIANRSKGELGVMTWDEQYHWDFDVIVLQRWMHENVPTDIRRARANGQIVVQDVDDWFFGMDPRNLAWRASHPKVNARENVNIYREALAASTCVTVSTPYLRDRLTACRDVRVLPNAIDLERWKPRTDRAGITPTVGWVGALAFRSGDLETLQGILGPFLERHGLGFHHSGHVPGGPDAGELAGAGPARTLPMAAIVDYPILLAPIDIGLVPLADVPFNHAKSAIKGLEYAAAGVPFIAAATPEYRAAEATGVGVTARRARDWIRELERLVDPEERALDAKRNRTAVEQYDIAGRVAAWEAVYQDLAS